SSIISAVYGPTGPPRVLWRVLVDAKRVAGEVNLMDDAASFFEQVRTGDRGAVSESLKRDRSLVNAKNEKGVSAILMACYAGQKEVRDLLLQEGAQLEVHEAVAAGQIKKVAEFVERDASVARGFSPDGF